MIRTKIDIDKIPSNWIFEYYCKTNEKLHGQDIKVLSLFNEADTVPSMCIYVNDNKYKFKDFSSGYGGDGIKLVMLMYDLKSRDSAVRRIIDDYEKQVDVIPNEIKPVSKFKITSHKKRKWNVIDAKYWLSFNIDSDILQKYNVFPLSYVTLSKNIDDNIVEFKRTNNQMYGYFKKDGTLYKTYQPKDKKRKFFNVSSYIQGTDQLEYKNKTLVIASSLKDMMSLDSLNLEIDLVAPGSENTLIPKSNMSSYVLKYDNIFTLFDNDDAGYRASDKYEGVYGINGLYLNLSKDVSDSISEYGVRIVKNCLKPLIPIL